MVGEIGGGLQAVAGSREVETRVNGYLVERQEAGQTGVIRYRYLPTGDLHEVEHPLHGVTTYTRGIASEIERIRTHNGLVDQFLRIS